MDQKLTGKRRELTTVQWNIYLPEGAQFTDVWHNSYSQSIYDLHRCELNFCMRLNESMGIDVAIRKDTWNILWRVKIHVMLCEIPFATESQAWSEYVIFPNAIKIDLLKTYGSKNSPIAAKCVIEWLYWTNNIITHEILPPSPMIRGMDDYLMNSKFSDVNVVVDGVELPAHKIVLAAQSNLFAKMLDSAPLLGNKIVLEQIDVELVKIVLKYLYTGYDEELNDFKTSLDILTIADKCDIPRLKRLCEHKLSGKLKIETASQILETADDMNLVDLRNQAINFIAKHKNDIMKLDNFKKMCLKKPQLSFEIFSFMFTGTS